MEEVIKEIGQPHQLKHVEPTHDASKPVVEPGVTLKTWDRAGHLQNIEAGVPLKHVETDDRSEPKIEPDVHLQPNHHRELLDEVRAAAAHAAVVREVAAVSSAAGAGDGDEDSPASALVQQLHHVQTQDKAAPAIDPATHVKQWDKEGFLKEVAAPHELHHVPPSEVADRSEPAIPADVHVGENPNKAVLQQIASGDLASKLKHVEAPR